MHIEFADVRIHSKAAIADNVGVEIINAVDVDVIAPNCHGTTQSDSPHAYHVVPTPIVPSYAIEEDDIPPDGGYGWIYHRMRLPYQR